jgi:hypothetical protein
MILGASCVCERGQTIWTDAHRGDRKRFVVREDEILTALWNFKRRSERQLAARFVTVRASLTDSVV